MKKQSITYLLIIGMFITKQIDAQVSVPNNTGFPTDYVGWATGNNFPLQIRHNANQPIQFFTNGLSARMSIGNGTLATGGYIGIGHAAPVDRLHIHQPSGAGVNTRLTNTATLATVTDGSTIGITSLGHFRLTQFEDRHIDFLTPNSILADTTRRFRIQPNGQVFIGNPSMLENVVNGFADATWQKTSLLNVRGPINSCAAMSSTAQQPTILYAYSSPVDNVLYTAEDGFRMHMNVAFAGIPKDALVFEKTDGNAPDPDGVIAFTNTGNDLVEEISAYIDGTGRTCFGENFLTLANRVTIDSDPGDASASGLRFADLTSTAMPLLVNPGNGVLAVDADGDVVYVPSGVGNYCGVMSNPMLSNYEIPLNNKNYFFSGNDGASINDVAMGYSCSYTPLAKLDVKHTGYTPGAHPPLKTTIAGNFLAERPDSDLSIGIRAVSNLTSGSSFGGQFFGYGTGNNVGVSAWAVGGNSGNTGIDGVASGNGSGISMGVYGSASGGSSNWAGYFNGPSFIAAAAWTYSDQNLKENITEYTGAGNVLSQLHLKSYQFKTAEYPQLNMEETPQIGLLSQELEQVLPHAVKNAESPAVYNRETGELEHPSVTFKAVSYEKLIPILVGGHQEQQYTMDSLILAVQLKDAEINALQQSNADLNARLTQLENCLQAMFPGMCQASSGMIQQNSPEMQQQLMLVTSISLSDKNAIVLNQNVPNPFAESTVIKYSVPATVKKAQIHFYDASGKLLQSVEITERGNGKLQVFGSDLSSGTYTYTLVADGEVASSKKLVKQ